VIFSAAGEVAAVSTPKGIFLPGGGQEHGEPPEKAAVRETREECGYDIVIRDRLGIADELVFAADESVYYHKRCTFFLAELGEKVGAGEQDHQVVWLSPPEALAKLRPESQRWALSKALRTPPGFPRE
jgi:8-oxo-dGTP pyrophosphatase MutT (NUDIX family)